MNTLLSKFSAKKTGLLFIALLIIAMDMGCGPTPACGNRRAHKARARSIHRMAPTM